MKLRQPTKWIPNLGQKNIVDGPEVQDCHPDDFHLFLLFFSHAFPFFHFQQTLQQFAKDIKITSTQVIQNLPKESREFTKTCKDYCEQWLDVRKIVLDRRFLVIALGNTRESIRWRWKQLILKLEKMMTSRIQDFFDLQICKENMDFGQSNWRDLFSLGDGIACDRVPMWINTKCQFLNISIFLILGSFHLWCDIILPSQMLGFLYVSLGGTFWVHDVRIMRGLNRVPQMVRPPVASVSSHTGEHPYLRRMTYRGGGYAILRALWDAEKSDNYSGDLFWAVGRF